MFGHIYNLFKLNNSPSRNLSSPPTDPGALRGVWALCGSDRRQCAGTRPKGGKMVCAVKMVNLTDSACLQLLCSVCFLASLPSRPRIFNQYLHFLNSYTGRPFLSFFSFLFSFYFYFPF